MLSVSKISVLVSLLAALTFAKGKPKGYLLKPPTECPPPGFKPSETFNLAKYISHPWYIQAQMDVAYTIGQDMCVGAYYTLSKKRRGLTGFFEGLFGLNKQKQYLDVHNTAKYSESNETVEATLLAVTDSMPGALKVGLNFLPEGFWGPYWVVAHDDDYDWAIVSGGPPNEVGLNGYCKTHNGTNGAGLWLFTKQQEPGRKRVFKMMMTARSLGYDITVLNPVSQKGCNYTALEDPFPVVNSVPLVPLEPVKNKDDKTDAKEKVEMKKTEIKSKVEDAKKPKHDDDSDDDNDDDGIMEKPIVITKKGPSKD